MPTNTYESPLSSRYASEEMLYLFSADKKFSTWRKLWVALARAEMELGLPVTQEQVDELEAHIYDIDYEKAAQWEKKLRHDVMAHVHTYGELCPKAMPIIHLGATSCYVTDNAEVIIIDRALDMVMKKLVNVMDKLKKFALRYKDLPTLGFTHLQPAQLVTVGKRATLWLSDLEMDYYNLANLKNSVKLRGVKGTTGTQASFLDLFGGDGEKVKELERRVVAKLGYSKVYGVTGQTYPRKFDYNVLCVLSQIAQSAYRFSNDIRLLQHMKEVEEPFEKHQIGSSAMAYKRNPMRSERVGSLARYVLSLPVNAAVTASTQWFERTLDDSANKRIVIAQAFLSVDAILNLYMNISENLVVYDKVIAKHIAAELASGVVGLFPDQIAYGLELLQEAPHLLPAAARLDRQTGDGVLPILRQRDHQGKQPPCLQAQAPILGRRPEQDHKALFPAGPNAAFTHGNPPLSNRCSRGIIILFSW